MNNKIHQIQEIDWTARTFVMRRAVLHFDKLSQFFAGAYKDIYSTLNKSGLNPTDPPFAIYFSVDPQKGETDLGAAVVIPDSYGALPGFEKITIPQSKALMVTYYGPYENMAEVYGQLDKYVEDHHLQKAWVLEEYFSDPMKEPDPAKWKTNVYYIVR